MDKEIIIYGKAGCPYTDKALSAFGEKAKYIDVGTDVSKLQEMLSYSNGVRKVPVIVDGGKVTIGYGGT
jgi:glutaredoxin 3